jgi:hypothetical protein
MSPSLCTNRAAMTFFLLLAGGASYGTGAAVVLAGLRACVPVGVVVELAEHPGAEDVPVPCQKCCYRV